MRKYFGKHHWTDQKRQASPVCIPIYVIGILCVIAFPGLLGQGVKLVRFFYLRTNGTHESERRIFDSPFVVFFIVR